MSETKHTPGPWRVSSGMVETEANSLPIAWMDREPGNGTLPVERDENARLIAAAPELLSALKAILGGQLHGSIDLYAQRFEDARAAVAKAEGK